MPKSRGKKCVYPRHGKVNVTKLQRLTGGKEGRELTELKGPDHAYTGDMVRI